MKEMLRGETKDLYLNSKRGFPTVWYQDLSTRCVLHNPWSYYEAVPSLFSRVKKELVQPLLRGMGCWVSLWVFVRWITLSLLTLCWRAMSTSRRSTERPYSLVEDLGSFVTREVLQLQRLLGEEGYSQVKVVVPQLGKRDRWREYGIKRIKRTFYHVTFYNDIIQYDMWARQLYS